MRYWIGLVLLLALQALPLSASAQDADIAAKSLPEPEDSALLEEPVSEEGTLSPRVRKRTRQQWDPEVYDVRQVPPSRPDKHTSRHGLDSRQRAGIGLGVSIAALGAGLGMATAGFANSICIFEPCSPPSWAAPVGITGALLMVGGIVGIAASGHEMRTANRERGSLKAARRVHWDLARSGLVF